MTIYNVIGKPGTGKTLLCVILAFLFKEYDDKILTFANLPIKIKDFTYIELGVIPFTKIKELNNVLIIFDDIKVLKNIDNFMTIVANMSRKNSFDIIFTSQYYTYLKREGRMLADYQVLTRYDKENFEMEVYLTDLDNEITPFKIVDCNKFYDKYDTTNIIEFPDVDDIYDYVKKNCNNVKDIKLNLKSILKKSEYKTVLKKIVRDFKLEN